MKYTLQLLLGVGLAVGLALWLAISTSSTSHMKINKVNTVIKYIDLPEEIDLISSNRHKPDTMLLWREMDTLHVYYR